MILRCSPHSVGAVHFPTGRRVSAAAGRTLRMRSLAAKATARPTTHWKMAGYLQKRHGRTRETRLRLLFAHRQVGAATRYTYRRPVATSRFHTKVTNPERHSPWSLVRSWSPGKFGLRLDSRDHWHWPHIETIFPTTGTHPISSRIDTSIAAPATLAPSPHLPCSRQTTKSSSSTTCTTPPQRSSTASS